MVEVGQEQKFLLAGNGCLLLAILTHLQYRNLLSHSLPFNLGLVTNVVPI